MVNKGFLEAEPTRGVSLLLKPYYGFGGTKPGARLTQYVLAPVDDWLVRRSGGRLSIVGSAAMRVLILTTTGCQSGQARRNTLTYIRDHDRLLILGSNFGQPQHPGWSSNLLAHPAASVTIAGAVVPVTATLLTGRDREAALSRFCTLSIYRRYCSRTDREMRVFGLARRN
jgi:deazaflavin-dependent oxidoreductase (nitroreductase family)